MFAKLFESPKYGQILVKLDTDPVDFAPEVRVYVKPKHLGVCSCAIGFQDDDQGWDLAEKALDEADLTLCEGAIKALFRSLDIAVEFVEDQT